jgi:hypothetical protein
MSHCQLVVEEFCRRVLAMVVDGDERGGGRVIKIRRAAGINALRKYKCTNSYGDMSLSQSLPNGRFEIPNGDKAIAVLSLLIFLPLCYEHCICTNSAYQRAYQDFCTGVQTLGKRRHPLLNDTFVTLLSSSNNEINRSI